MNILQYSIRLTTILFITFIMSSTLSTAVQAGNVVRVGGAGTGLGTIKILGEAFEKSHPGTTIRVLPNLGSSGGIKALLHNALDVAISGRILSKNELNDGAVAVECARTPFVFVVNPKVNKNNITTRELEMIYNGQLSKWPDGTRIRLILRPAGDTDTSILKNISKSMEQSVKVANTRLDMIIAVTDQEAVDSVAKIPGALGGSTLAQIETEKAQVKILPYNGIMPTLDALAKGNYPLAKPLYLVSTKNTPATALQFIQFVQSEKGQAILAKSGAIPSVGNKRNK